MEQILLFDKGVAPFTHLSLSHELLVGQMLCVLCTVVREVYTRLSFHVIYLESYSYIYIHYFIPFWRS